MRLTVSAFICINANSTSTHRSASLRSILVVHIVPLVGPPVEDAAVEVLLRVVAAVMGGSLCSAACCTDACAPVPF